MHCSHEAHNCSHVEESKKAKEYFSSHYAVVLMAGDLLITDAIVRLIDKAAFIVCADGGIKHLENLTVRASLLLGDFDSIDSSTLDLAKSMQIPIETHPVHKDMTDGELAIDRTIQEGYINIYILGSSGNFRPDHFLSNLKYALFLSKNFKTKIVISDGNNFFIPFAGPIKLDVNLCEYFSKDQLPKVKISILQTTSIENLTYEGLAYDAKQLNTPYHTSQLMSNQIQEGGEEFSFSLDCGEGFLCLCLDN